MFLGKIAQIYQPAVYQGSPTMKGYFEGWYYKIVAADDSRAMAIIPGISFDEKGNSHCFVQVLDGIRAASWYANYPATQFNYSKKRFEITVGPNSFNASGIKLDIVNNDIAIKGQLSFTALNPWPVKLFSPGAMGWYAFMPFMECYHGVISMDHAITGSLVVNSEEIDFSGGRGYTEKDWGRSFPAYHVWLQTNHFPEKGAAVMVSIARIPWIGKAFDGFIAGMLFNGQLYQFTTYNGTRLTSFAATDETVSVEFTSRRHRLKVSVSRAQGAHLAAPANGAMKGQLIESMAGTATVTLYSQQGGRAKLLYEGISRNTALEIAGDISGIVPVPENKLIGAANALKL